MAQLQRASKPLVLVLTIATVALTFTYHKIGAKLHINHNFCFDKFFLDDWIEDKSGDGASCSVSCKSEFHSSPNVPFQIAHSLPILSLMLLALG